MPPRKSHEHPLETKPEATETAPQIIANPEFEGGDEPFHEPEAKASGEPPEASALLGDGANRDEPDAADSDEDSASDPHGLVEVESTGPTVVVHGHTLAAGRGPIAVPNDAETQEQVAAGLIVVVE